MFGVTDAAWTIKNTFVAVEEESTTEFPERRAKSVPASFRPSQHFLQQKAPSPPPGFMYVAISAADLAWKDFYPLEFSTPQVSQRWSWTGAVTEFGVPVVQYMQPTEEASCSSSSNGSQKGTLDASPVSTEACSELSYAHSVVSDDLNTEFQDDDQQDEAPPPEVLDPGDAGGELSVPEAVPSHVVPDDVSQGTDENSRHLAPSLSVEAKPVSPKRRRAAQSKKSVPAVNKLPKKQSGTADGALAESAGLQARSNLRLRAVRFAKIFAVFVVSYVLASTDVVAGVSTYWSTYWGQTLDYYRSTYPSRGEITPPRRTCACQDSRVWKDEDGDGCFVYRTYLANGVISRSDACTHGVMSDSAVGEHCPRTCGSCTCDEVDQLKPVLNDNQRAQPTQESLLALYGLSHTNQDSVYFNVDPGLIAKAIGTAASMGYRV